MDDRRFRSLSLGLGAEIAADILQINLEAPASLEPQHELGLIASEVGAEQGLGRRLIQVHATTQETSAMAAR